MALFGRRPRPPRPLHSGRALLVPWALRPERRRPMPDLKDPSLYLNREISWLGFNRRVLEEAMDDTQPPLERLKFLSIVDSNLTEFFEVRVARLHQQAE